MSRQLRGGLLVGCLLVAAGCGQEPVREDRSADWSRDGGGVAFQHDQAGVFVAGKDGQGLQQIFQPDADVLATSRPLHSPTDDRLIFTTATDPQRDAAAPAEEREFRPEGNVAWQRPVRYTCWLQPAATAADTPAPYKLFSASCEHLGYVSAGLAVRWHPEGQRILYIDTEDKGDHRHGVFEWDLTTHQSRQVFPHRMEAVACDYSPGGSYLVCVTGTPENTAGGPGQKSQAGLWLTETGKDSWRQIPGVQPRAQGELPSLLEGLRLSRPVWAAGDAKFACVAHLPARSDGAPERSRLLVVTLQRDGGELQPRIEELHELEGLFTDLHWTPDGQSLGFVQRPASGAAALRIYGPDGRQSDVVEPRPVRRFAGFEKSGARMAYVVADETGLPREDQDWNYLLLADRRSRDRVVVRDTGDPTVLRDVFSGLLVTFPAWSPREDRLSLWLTFVPRYRSVFSLLFRWGLRPGDPAATIDLGTGDVSWMAISPAEELQIGHYYLLRREYDRAWEWYARAHAKLPERQAPHDLLEFLNAVRAPEQSRLFESYCLQQLGRVDEARAKLAEFEDKFFISPAPAAAGAQASAPVPPQFDPATGWLPWMLHDLFVAEVFLSLEAPEAGLALLQAPLPGGAGELAELSRSLVRTQILLATGRRDEYLAVCAQELAPRASTVWQAGTVGGAGAASPANPAQSFELSTWVGLSLLPLAYPEFLADIGEAPVQAAVEQWQARRAALTHNELALAVDLFLRAAALRLGHDGAAREIEARILKNPLTPNWLAGKSITQALQELRGTARLSPAWLGP